MHHRCWIAPSLLACLATGPATVPAPATVRIRAVRVVEHRFARLDPKSDATANPDAGLQVSLQVVGLPDLPTATGYGHWHVDAATDDRGTDLSPMKMPDAERYVDLDRDASDDLKPGPDGFAAQMFDVQLGVPARGATALRRVAGHFDVTLGGTDHVARFGHPTRLVGQTLADADLRAAGVSVTFDRPDPADGPSKPSQVTFHLHGGPGMVHDDMLDIVGADGKTVVTSWDASGPSSEAEHPHTYDLSRPLDDAMTITVRARLGLRTLRIPFDLRDVPLP